LIVHALRLYDGQDLRKEIEAEAYQAGFTAGFVLTCVGGLSRLLRMPGTLERRDWIDELEIVSLSGTISKDGCHLHGSFSDRTGQVIGGHVLEGCSVRLSAEVVLGAAEHLRFGRPHDHDTGFRELTVESCEPANSPGLRSSIA
jgi:uncharacterized protein